MIAITSLLLTAATSFSGGTVDDLAQSIAQETGKNAVIVTAFAVPKLEAFKYDAGSADDLAASISKGAKLKMAPGSDPIFSDRLYVGDHFRSIAPRLPSGPGVAKSVPSDLLTSGKVTLQTAGSLPISISMLATVKWSQPIRVDYMMQDLAVSASVKDMPERAFLDAVAKAAGGFVTTDDKGYHMAYDVDQLRLRIGNTLKQETVGEPRQVVDAKRDFYIATVSILPADTLMTIFLTPGLEPTLNVLPNTDLSQAAVAYVKDVESIPSRPFGGTPDGGASQPRGRGARNANTDILSRVDNRAIVHLRLNASGEIVLAVPVIQGRQSSYIDI